MLLHAYMRFIISLSFVYMFFIVICIIIDYAKIILYSVKHSERANGPDTALYKSYLYLLHTNIIITLALLSRSQDKNAVKW